MNVAAFLITIAQRLGADTGFSLTGGMAMHINHAAGTSALRMIYCNHEQACVAAADGYAKMHDYRVPGLAIVTSGPGVTNSLTSLASAYYDSVPLILIAGQVKTSDINRFGVRSFGAQEVPSMDLVKPIVKDAIRYIPETTDDERLANVFASALSGRKGPIFIEVPLNVQTIQVEHAEERIHEILGRIESSKKLRPVFDEVQQNIIASALNDSLRPVLYVGNGNRISGTSRNELARLVETLEAPVLMTWPSGDLLDSRHRLNFGCPGGLAGTHSNRILQRADVILFLGARLDLLTTGFSPERFGKRALRIIVDIDPAELAKFARLADAHLILADSQSVVDWLRTSALNIRRDTWLEECARLRGEDSTLEEQSFANASVLNARNIAKAFSERLRETTTVATGSGYAIEGFARFFASVHGNRLIYAGHSLGAMGMGLPSAIGAASVGTGPVVCLEGDGGILLNVQELLTLQANPDLRLSIGVLNNDGYVSISRSQRRVFGSEYGASRASGLGAADFCALASMFKFDYVKLSNKQDLESVLDEIKSGRSRVLFDVQVTEDDYRGPAIATRFREDGTPYSSDIEEAEWKQPRA
jgi:acetolactate synthase I/II/III large subunit